MVKTTTAQDVQYLLPLSKSGSAEDTSAFCCIGLFRPRPGRDLDLGVRPGGVRPELYAGRNPGSE